MKQNRKAITLIISKIYYIVDHIKFDITVPPMTYSCSPTSRLLFLIFGLFLITMDVYAQEDLTVDEGDQAYNFIGIDEEGKEIALEDYRGKQYVLLNFTATYCGPCWGTYEQMNRVQKKYAEELKVISFHWDDAKAHWKKMAEKAKIDFECTSIWEAKDKAKISEVYQIDGWPYFFLIDKEGTIVAKWFGNNEKKLNRKIKKWVL